MRAQGAAERISPINRPRDCLANSPYVVEIECGDENNRALVEIQ
jgi:hypothetical protein